MHQRVKLKHHEGWTVAAGRADSGKSWDDFPVGRRRRNNRVQTALKDTHAYPMQVYCISDIVI